MKIKTDNPSLWVLLPILIGILNAAAKPGCRLRPALTGRRHRRGFARPADGEQRAPRHTAARTITAFKGSQASWYQIQQGDGTTAFVSKRWTKITTCPRAVFGTSGSALPVARQRPFRGLVVRIQIQRGPNFPDAATTSRAHKRAPSAACLTATQTAAVRLRQQRKRTAYSGHRLRRHDRTGPRRCHL